MSAGDPEHVELVLATLSERTLVERLLQLYEYDFSEIMAHGVDVDEQGLFHTVDTEAIWQPGYSPFLVKVAGKYAGLAFVTHHRSYFGDEETMLMDEFFILRAYRRRGIGEYVAHRLFDRFPGPWEVSELPENTAAQAFWRRVIGRYTAGAYQEMYVNSDRWRGPVQRFVSGARMR